MKKWIALLVILFPAVMAIVAPAFSANAPAVVVGRVYHIEGDLLRYVPAENDWVAVVKDAPFGTGDTLFSGTQGMSELIVPNGTWIRTGYSTQIQFINLDTEVSEMDVASGVARLYNKGGRTVIKTTCPFGYVLANPGSIFDIYVGDASVEVIAVKGTVSFVHSSTQGRYDVAAGSPSVLADQNQVSSGEGAIDPTWDQWNRGRDDIWAARMRNRRSAEYLPPPLQEESYVLDDNGSWETVNYEGVPRRFWRPRVAPGWAPFTNGRWTEWEGDQTWVPAEPFGYMTHHYGNWVLIGGGWYWAPPVVTVRTGLPLLDIGFAWMPGRVSWIHSGDYVGWVPLAPGEPYYSHHHWGGRRDIVITDANMGRINTNVGSYAYARQAVIVNQTNFYSVNNYKTVQVTNVNKTTIINNYRAAPVINNTVIKNYNTNNQRFNFANVPVREKPHNSVLTRIQQNDKIIPQAKQQTPVQLQQQIKKMPEGKINRQAQIAPPKATNYIVPANQVNKPKSEIKLPQREIKPAGKGPGQGQPGQVAPGKPVQPGQVTQPPKPGQPGHPGQVTQPPKPVQPGQVTPQPGQPGHPGQVAQPPKPGQPGQVTPQQPGQPGHPGQVTQPPKPVQPGQVTPQPGQPGHPGQVAQPPRPGQPGQVTPQHPGQPGHPGQVAQPPRPGQPGHPGQVTPQPEQPTQPGHITAPPKPSQPSPGPQPNRPPQPTAAQPQHPAPQPAAPPKPAMQGPAPQPQHVAPPKPAPQPAPGPRPQQPAPQKPAMQAPAPKPQPAAPPKPAPQPAPQKPAPAPAKPAPAKPAPAKPAPAKPGSQPGQPG